MDGHVTDLRGVGGRVQRGDVGPLLAHHLLLVLGEHAALARRRRDHHEVFAVHVVDQVQVLAHVRRPRLGRRLVRRCRRVLIDGRHRARSGRY